jgi:Rrf2 family protein
MISQKTKYAIKALICLAKQDKGELLRIADISEEENIPKKFLEQILVDLKHASLVDSVQGPKGGYLLTKNPKKINLVDIHRLFDGPVALVPCVSLNFYHPCADCKNPKKCTISLALANVRDQTLKSMKHITIHSLIP